MMNKLKTFEGFFDDFKTQWKRDVTGTLPEHVWIHIDIFGKEVFIKNTFDNKPNTKLIQILKDKFDINYTGNVAKLDMSKVSPVCDFLESLGLKKMSLIQKKMYLDILKK